MVTSYICCVWISYALVSHGWFNELLDLTDKIGGRPLIPSRVHAFHDCLTQCGLFDLATSGPNCTRTNKNWDWWQHTREKLDWAFINAEWQVLFLFPKGHCLTLPRFHSYHHPIIISTDGWEKQSSLKQFIFQLMRQTHHLLQQIVAACWLTHESQIMGLDNFTSNFYKKIHHLQSCLADWKTNVFGQVALNKKRIHATTEPCGLVVLG